MIRHFLIIVALIVSIACILVCGNCDGESGSSDQQTGQSAQNQVQSDCLYQNESKTDDDEEETHEEVIDLFLSDDATLFVGHYNTSRQCGLWLNVTYDSDGDTIEITEGDRQDAMTGCMCCFDLEYEIPVQSTEFTLVIYRKSPGSEREEILSRQVDFLTQDDYSFSLGEVACAY